MMAITDLIPFRSLETFKSFYQPLTKVIRNPSLLRQYAATPQELLTRVRNMDRKEMAFIGVTAAEVIGFFTVGEVIGRRKIVGYRGEPAHGH
jgi:F-type H+-transporting ATPase subunit g